MSSTKEMQRWLVEHQALERTAVDLLGTRGWALMRSYGRIMSGPRSGFYVSALSAAEVLPMLDALAQGNEVDVHLMHRHKSGNYDASALRLEDGRLAMHFADRVELA